MGKAGKRKEMVEDQCVQEIYVEGRCMKEFRVKVLLVKEVCVKAWCKGLCHAKWRSMLPNATPRRPRHPLGSVPPEPISATPATQSEGPCLEVPRLPGKVNVYVAKCRTFHAKQRSMPMSPSATPALQSGSLCRQVPRLPRKQPQRPRRPLGNLGTKRATRASPVT